MPAESASSGPPRLVCRCLGVSSLRIEAAIAGGGASDLGAVGRVTRAGTGCEACHPEIREILAVLAGEAVPEPERRANRERCRHGTEERIESVLLEIAPHLPPAARVEVVWVQGLRVDLHLAPRQPALEAAIAERLRKRVCPDLEVVFG